MSDFNEAFSYLESWDEQPTVRENYVKAPFGWPGGKSKSIQQIIPRLPVRERYIEPCGGSGAILLARQESKLEVFNDRYSGVTDFFRCIKDPILLNKFIESFYPTIHSRELFIHYKNTWAQTANIVERAVKWYYTVLTSFGSQQRNFGRSTAGNNAIGIKLSSRIPLLTEVSRRIARTQIENQDMFQMINDFDHSDAVYYLDPPYVDYCKGIYDYDLCHQDHLNLCKKIMEMKSFVAISGYENNIYDQFHWDDKYEWEATVYSTAMAFTEENGLKNHKDQIQRRTVKECLWIKEAY